MSAVSIRVAAATDVGHVRRRNEDHAVIATTLLTGSSARRDDSHPLPLLVAALDGMGGHPAGDVASRLVAEALATTPPPTDGAAVADLVDTLQRLLTDHMDRHPETVAMGTTLSAAALHRPDRALVFGIGDSSALWWADDRLDPVLPRDRAPGGGITQVLGGSFAREDLRAHVAVLDGPGRLVLCTDGVADVVGASGISDLVAGSDLAAATDGLVRAALAAGGPDNATAVLVDLAAAN